MNKKGIIVITAGQLESDYQRWFKNNMVTFTGVEAGYYLGMEYFYTYGMFVAKQLRYLENENKELITQLAQTGELLNSAIAKNKVLVEALQGWLKVINRSPTALEYYGDMIKKTENIIK